MAIQKGHKAILILLALIMVLMLVILTIIMKPREKSYTGCNFLPLFDSTHLVSHRYYSLCYNPEYRQPYWVEYTIKSGTLQHNYDRGDNFRVDPYVTSDTWDGSSYYKSGFDRGHYVPAEDMSFDSIALSETFYYSNIAPQLPGFNRGIWKRLENYVRNITADYDSIIVIAGPVINKDLFSSEDTKLVAPSYFYKLLVSFLKNSINATAYLIPHQEGLTNLSDYIISIDSLESITGLDFFYYLPDKLEKRLEK